jgi:pyruvate dehydrogenase E1 component
MAHNPMLLTEQDIATENREWIESLDYVYANQGPERVKELLRHLQVRAQEKGAHFYFSANTPYINTIPHSRQPPYPGSREIERRIKSLIRWNAMAMVVRANKKHAGLGGHISTFASSATLYEVGFNHFFRAKSADHPGDIIFFQGHAAPGIYARAFLGNGELDEPESLGAITLAAREELDNLRYYGPRSPSWGLVGAQWSRSM